ncbi:MAG: condensation domain-containing protein, partial [Pseudomonas sp.]
MEINPHQLAERIARLTPQKREAFAAALAAQGIALSRLPIVPSPDEGPRPLSWAQQRLWFLHRLDPDSSAYNMPAALRLRGTLDMDALQYSFDQLVARHGILRSTFHEAEGKAHQVVHPQRPLVVARIDLSNEHGSDGTSRLQQLIDSETNRPFDLQQAALRCLLVKLSDDEHVLVLTAQHIVADGWSLGVLVKELTAFYSAALQGVEAQLPALPVQYCDYASWQQTCLSDSALAPELNYWRERLAGEQPFLELPTDHPRGKQSSGRGARHYLGVDPALTEGLRQLAKARGTTLFTVLLSAFNVL